MFPVYGRTCSRGAALPICLSNRQTDGWASQTIGNHSGNSAEAHGFSRVEEARKLRETTHRYRQGQLPN